MGVATAYLLTDGGRDDHCLGAPPPERARAEARHAACLRLAATAIKAAWIEAASQAGAAFGARAIDAVRNAWLESQAAAEHRTLMEMADRMEVSEPELPHAR